MHQNWASEGVAARSFRVLGDAGATQQVLQSLASVVGGGAEHSNVPGMGWSCTGVAGLLSMAESGLGGAIVPKRIDARCFAEPPTGAGPSSSLDSSFSDSASQSSSSCRRRDLGFSVSCCWAMRWKGLVEDNSFGALGAAGGGENAWACGIGGAGGGAAGAPVSELEETFLKY